MKIKRRISLICAVCVLAACRQDTTTNTDVATGSFGESGGGPYTAQCSGWYPDWISQVPPAASETDFQMSQGYYLGVPVLQTVNGNQVLQGYKRPADATVTDAPWLAFDFHTQQVDYTNSLLQYVLTGNADTGFIISPGPFGASWFNVPMMTTNTSTRREPLHGLTVERTLHHADWHWINGTNALRSYAIGYYNVLGSYTIGQVFKDVDPTLADPSKASFVNGTLVFKILFSEYDPTKIDAATYPLTHAPEWIVQDVSNPAAANNVRVRLIQMDIAVKDARSPTGWVFATYDYDESNTDSNPWKRLTAVGMMWGDDPASVDSGPINETWLNPALPNAFRSHIGHNGRLVGPVDNKASSCISCHSTAQVDVGVTTNTNPSSSAFTGAVTVPPSTGGAACSVAQRAAWFRDLPSGTPFGMTDGTPVGTGCNVVPTSVGTLRSLDNSLQLQVGLVSSLYRGNTNPCVGKTPGQTEAPQAPPGSPIPPPRRNVSIERQRVVVTSKELTRALRVADEHLPKR